jgi:hypothetical protein
MWSPGIVSAMLFAFPACGSMRKKTRRAVIVELAIDGRQGAALVVSDGHQPANGRLGPACAHSSLHLLSSGVSRTPRSRTCPGADRKSHRWRLMHGTDILRQ